MTTTNGVLRGRASDQSTGTTEVAIDTGIDVADGEVAIIEAHVLATNGANAHYVLRAAVQGTTGGGTVLGQNQDAVYESSTALDAAIDINSGNLEVAVTGLATTNIDWDVWFDVMVK